MVYKVVINLNNELFDDNISDSSNNQKKFNNLEAGDVSNNDIFDESIVVYDNDDVQKIFSKSQTSALKQRQNKVILMISRCVVVFKSFKLRYLISRFITFCSS